MKSIGYVYAAYIATWLIHGTCLAVLVRKYGRMKKELETPKTLSNAAEP